MNNDVSACLLPFLFLTSTLASAASEKELTALIPGKWSYSVVLPISDDTTNGTAQISCLDTYFANKGVNYSCTMTANIQATGDSSEVTQIQFKGDINATGEWSVSEDMCLEKLVDARVKVISASVNREGVTDPQQLKDFETAMQDSFIRGFTSSGKIIFIDRTRWVSEDELDGQTYTVSKVRK